MAWNSKKKCYECDRCGRSIGYFTTQTLCKECNEWLKEYMSKRKEHTDGTISD